MADPRPTIGRIVHYWTMRAKPVTCEMYVHPEAAIITDVYPESDSADLTVFPPPYSPDQQQHGSILAASEVPYSDVPRAGYWSWPARA